MLINAAEHPAASLDADWYRRVRVPRPIYEELVGQRGWLHRIGIDAKAQNSPLHVGSCGHRRALPERRAGAGSRADRHVRQQPAGGRAGDRSQGKPPDPVAAHVSRRALPGRRPAASPACKAVSRSRRLFPLDVRRIDLQPGATAGRRLRLQERRCGLPGGSPFAGGVPVCGRVAGAKPE